MPLRGSLAISISAVAPHALRECLRKEFVETRLHLPKLI